MKIKLAFVILLFAACALPAGDPPGLFIWTASELKAFAKSLSPKIDANHVASQQLTAFGNYSFMMAHREGPGLAEFHDIQANILVIQTGEGTLVYGGKMVDAKTTAPNEQRGPSIAGGIEKKIAAGDVITIPAKVPHLMKVDSGKEITYFVVKVTQ